MNAPIRLDLIAPEIGRIAEQLLPLCGGDEILFADMVEGETDIAKVCSRILAMIEEEEGKHAALTEQMAVRKERRDRCEARTDVLKGGLLRIMKAAMLHTLKLPEATLSVGTVKAKLSVVNADAVPEQFTVTTAKPSMEKIKETYNVDGALPNWLSVDPARSSLSIRRK
jgi:hypothetical protein